MSAIADHACNSGHLILWEEATILDQARRQNELLVKEALHISLAPESERFNRDCGMDFPVAGSPPLSRT